MADYIKAGDIETQAEATEGTSVNLWTSLASAVSRIFDRACAVDDDFFSKAETATTELTFAVDNSKYLRLPPIVKDSLTQILIDDVAETDYKIRDEFIIFERKILDTEVVKVTARFGFSAIPFEIQQACIEQALLMWRRKDLNFTEIAGVSSGAVLNPFSPTFEVIAKEYRDKYGQFNYFE